MTQAAQGWFRKNSERFSGQLLFDEPLSRHTYYRIGGPCVVLAAPKTKDDLDWLRQGILESKLPLFVLGQGSNLLVSDQGFRGVVVRAGRLNLEILESTAANRIRTGGSVAISTLLRRAAHEGWGGLEFLTGIPGSIGGAVRMNAGTHLGETQKAIRKVESFSLLGSKSEMKIYEGDSLKFEYRKNLFLPQDELVWAAEWEIEKTIPATVAQKIQETLVRRKSTQPIDLPSCGSVFKNPKSSGRSAWQVVDQLGLRGHRVGGAQISEKHSNFIVNLGPARAEDVLALIRLAKTRAQNELGILLEEEVIYLGF